MASDRARGFGAITRMQPRNGDTEQVAAHLASWYRTAGRALPGTRLHLLLALVNTADTVIDLHLFESAAAYRRLATNAQHRAWQEQLAGLLVEPPREEQVAVRWNAASGARPRVSVSIDRDVHATVEDLIGRLLDRHPRTPAEELYLALLQSIAEEYAREYPATVPEEGDPR